MSQLGEIVRIDSDAVVTQYGYSEMVVKKPLVSFPREASNNDQDELARAAGGHVKNHVVYKVENANGVIYIGFKDAYMHIGLEIEPRGF